MLRSGPTPAIGLDRRNAEGLFTLHDLRGEPEIRLESIDCLLRTAEVFEGVDPPPA